MNKGAKKSDAQLTGACAAAKSGDTIFGGLVIRSIIEKLKAEVSLPNFLAKYLAESLEQCLADPTNAGKALRLVAPTNGRPQGKFAQRDFEIVYDISNALISGQSQEKAFAAVAGEHHVSESRAAQLWRASRMVLKEANARKSANKTFIDLSCEPSGSQPKRKIKLEK